MYYVVGEGGAKYGPADLDTLKQWAAENRLTPAMTLEDAATGTQMPANQVPGLFPATPVQPILQTPASPLDPGVAATPEASSPYQSSQQTYQDPAQPQNPYTSSGPYSQNPYQTPATYNRSSGATGDSNTIIIGWVMFGLGVLCCFLFSPVAIFFGKKAKDEGHPQGNLVMILGIVWTCLGACGTILWIIGFAASMNS